MLIDALIRVTIAAGSCQAGQAIGRLVSVQGAVELNLAAATPEALVCAGDVVYVAARSRAAILLLNTETILRLDQESELRLQPPLQPRRSVLELLKGAAYLFSREPRSLDVRTPYVNAAAEGTEFLVRVEPDQTFISVFEGRVLAANPQGQLSLSSNQSASAPANQPPQLATVVRPRDAVQWTLYYQPVLAALLDPAAHPPQRLPGIGSSWDDSAITRLSEQLEQTPPDERDQNFYVFRAGLWLTVGQVAPARSDLDQALKLTPDYSPALALLAMIAVTQNDQDSALKLANQAVQRDPNSAAARIALSYAQQAQFDLNGALASLQQAVQVNPRNALAQARLAELWLSLGYLDKALAAAQQAVTLNPNLARTQTVLGFAYLTRIKIKEAQRAFTRAIELDQADPLPRLGLGLAKIRRGKLQDGRSDIEIAVSLNPDNSLLRSYMGKAYYAEKRDPLATSQYGIAKELDPLDPTPWFYQAILKQTINRPVEALHDLQESVELNDNRGVFRSRFMLDQDLASRGARQGRIYRNLGFEQAGLVEGWKSLQSDQGNHSAHRLLSDTYSTLPRHEIAQDSELLQSQLLQPVNVNPVLPLLADNGLRRFYENDVFSVGFNEYSSLFAANQLRFSLDSLTGTNSTFGDNLNVYGIYNNLSFSLGQFHFETNGIRENNDLTQDIYNAFIQYNFSYWTSAQIEFRSIDEKSGNRYLLFDPQNFFRTERIYQKSQSVRLGLRHDFSPNSILIGNFSSSDSEDNITNAFDLTEARLGAKANLDNCEFRYLYRQDLINFTLGSGYLEGDFTRIDALDPSFPFEKELTSTQYNGYFYSYLNYPKDFHLTLGANADSFKRFPIDDYQLNPKIGFTWNLFPNTILRAAAFKTLTRPFFSNQTIEPTQVAGFNQFFDDFDGTRAWRYGVGIDQTIMKDISWGVEFSKRNLNVPVIFGAGLTSEPLYTDKTEKMGRGYLYWTPTNRLALSLTYQFEEFDDPEGLSDVALYSSKTHRLPLQLSFFDPSGLFLITRVTYIDQKGEFQDIMAAPIDGEDSFSTVDASLGYRLPKRLGTLAIGILNLFDKSFEFQDTDPRNPTILPERFVQFTLNLMF